MCMIPGTRANRGERLSIVGHGIGPNSDAMLNVHFSRTEAPKEGSTAEREIAEAIAKLVKGRKLYDRRQNEMSPEEVRRFHSSPRSSRTWASSLRVRLACGDFVGLRVCVIVQLREPLVKGLHGFGLLPEQIANISDTAIPRLTPSRQRRPRWLVISPGAS